MCGIAGLFHPKGLPSSAARIGELVEEMTSSLTHRGPDQAWTRLVGPSPARPAEPPIAALGVRRLAIVDVRGGTQPASDASRRWWVCLNGEIYNHGRIRQELQAEGVPFRGEGDAEAVAQLVARIGVSTALERLVGQFALAIVDTHTRKLWLVRDRMGQKPLYWGRTRDGTIAWGSELRALRPVPGLSWTPEPAAARALLLWEFIPSPLTPWKGVHKLEPGGLLELDTEGYALRRWYIPPVPRSGSGGDHRQWARSVRGSVQVAVLQRLRADVEVGALLSGGLDSTFVCALAQQARSAPVQSFGVSIRSSGFDEGPHSRAAAAEIGTLHRELPLEVASLESLSASVFAHMDEPLADSSLLATWHLMAEVRSAGLKCVLSGDGADELFGGYPTVLAHRLLPLLGPLRGLAGRVLRLRRAQQGGVTRDYMVRRLFSGVSLPFPLRHQTWMGAWHPSEVPLDPILDGLLSDAAAPSAGVDDACRALHLDQRLYMADGVLAKVDRASMAHGVEVRSPFMDHRVVELAADIGLDHKVAAPRPAHLRRGGVFQGKKVLKTAAAELVPLSVRQRAKQGFGTPVGPWLRQGSTVDQESLVEVLEDILSPDLLRRVISEHLDGSADHRRRLWSAQTLARWRTSKWGAKPCPPAL